MHFGTGELFQVYLAGIESGRSLPLEELTGEPEWNQGRLLAARDPRRMTIGDFERRRDLEDVETRMFVSEQSAAIAKAFFPFSELAAKMSRFAAAISVDPRLFRITSDAAGIAALCSIPKPLFPPVSLPENRLR